MQLNSSPSHRPPKQSTSRPVPGACEPETAASGHLAGPWGVLCRPVGARLVHCREPRLVGPRLGLPRVPEGGFPSKVVQMKGKRELNRSVDKARHHRGARKEERAERGQGTHFTPWNRNQAPNLYSRSQMSASDIVENHPTRFFVKFYALNVYCRPISPTPAPCTGPPGTPPRSPLAGVLARAGRVPHTRPCGPWHGLGGLRLLHDPRLGLRVFGVALFRPWGPERARRGRPSPILRLETVTKPQTCTLGPKCRLRT